MALPQKKFRELVFQILYSLDLGSSNQEEVIELMMGELTLTKKIAIEGFHRACAIREKQPEIDALIAKITHSYAFSRIQTVERNILRLSIYELLYDQEIPPKVAIAEALRLAKKFSTPESASFVNAILDNLYKMSQGDTCDQQEVEEKLALMEESENIASQAAKESKTDEE